MSPAPVKAVEPSPRQSVLPRPAPPREIATPRAVEQRAALTARPGMGNAAVAAMARGVSAAPSAGLSTPSPLPAAPKLIGRSNAVVTAAVQALPVAALGAKVAAITQIQQSATAAGDAGALPAAPPAAANAGASATPAAESGAASPAAKGQSAGGAGKSAAPGGAAAKTAAPEVGERANSAGASAGPAQDAGFQRVVGKVRKTAAKQRAHAPAGVKAAQAQAAAVGPPGEVASRAQDRHVQEMDSKQPRPFNRAAFKAALLAKIKDTAPKNLEEADDFKENGKVAGIKADLQGTVKEGKKDAAGPVADSASKPADASGIAPKPVTPMPPVEAGPPAGDVGATAATPKPRSDAEISLQAGPKQVEQQMAAADVTDDQLKNSNEPTFQGAVAAKDNAKKQSDAAPLAFRAEEKADLGAARADAAMVAHRQLGAMHGERGKMMTAAFGHQTDAKAKDEQRRAEVASHIQGIYDKAKGAVEKRLTKLDDDVSRTFDQGATSAQKAFEDYVDQRMRAYKSERYSGVRGKIRWAGDKLFGMPDAVNAFYVEGRDLYVAQMDRVLDDVTTTVETGLTEAKGTIATARQEITTYVNGLEPALRDVGKEAAQEIGDKLDQLEQSVNEKQDQLIDALAQKYNERMKQVDERITAMKAANRGLVDALKDAVIGIIQTIIKLKNMLLNVLSRVASAVGLIIKDPIGFLGNLVAGVKLGVQNFSARIAEHMKQGFMDWMFGAVAKTGIQLPKTFDAKGILSLVLQVLGLTWPNIRARAVAILGEKMVAALETAAEIFTKLITEGPGALWEWIKEKLSDLKAMVIDQLISFITERVIVAGVTWLISLLNPASAFIKACKAIYDIIMFFVERASQIAALINAVIDSITAIAKGDIGGAAAKVENALAKAIPVVIGFLAALLNLSGVTDKIKSVIEAVRQPINKAIDWVINKAVTMVKAAGKAIGGLLGGKKKEQKPEDDKEHDPEKAAKITAALGDIHARAEQKAAAGPLSDNDAADLERYAKKEFQVFSSVAIQLQDGEWYLSYAASPKKKEALVPGVKELEELKKKVRYAGQLIEVSEGRYVLLAAALKKLKATVRGNPGRDGSERDAFREAAAAGALGSFEGVTDVALGDAAYQDIHGPGKSHPKLPAVDVSATTKTGSRLLAEGKGLAEPGHAIEQFEVSTEALKGRGITVDGYYIFKPVGAFTQPGYSVEQGILMYNGKPSRIDGKPVYVVDIEPSGDQLKAFIEGK